MKQTCRADGGGGAAGTFFADLHFYDPQKRLWSLLPATGQAPPPLSFVGITLTADGDLYLSCGNGQDGIPIPFRPATWPSEGSLLEWITLLQLLLLLCGHLGGMWSARQAC